MVAILVAPSRWVSLCHRWLSNCAPRSVVMDSGTPYREIQFATKASATVSAVASGIGQRVASVCSGRRRSVCTAAPCYLVVGRQGPDELV